MYANEVTGLRPKLFEWGMNDRRVKYWPYWRTRDVISCNDPDVLVSMWTLPDRSLLCAFNTSKKEAANASIRVPMQDLGLMPDVRGEFVRASDLEDGRVTFDAWEGRFDSIRIAPHDFRMLVIRKYID